MTEQKGKTGVALVFFAVAAFFCVMVGGFLPLLLIIGYAVMLERDQWLTRQVLQAGVLYIGYHLIRVVILDWFIGSLQRFIAWIVAGGGYYASPAMAIISDVISAAIGVIMILYCVLALLRILKHKDANLPYLSRVVDRLMSSSPII